MEVICTNFDCNQVYDSDYGHDCNSNYIGIQEGDYDEADYENEY